MNGESQYRRPDPDWLLLFVFFLFALNVCGQEFLDNPGPVETFTFTGMVLRVSEQPKVGKTGFYPFTLVEYTVGEVVRGEYSGEKTIKVYQQLFPYVPQMVFEGTRSCNSVVRSFRHDQLNTVDSDGRKIEAIYFVVPSLTDRYCTVTREMVNAYENRLNGHRNP